MDKGEEKRREGEEEEEKRRRKKEEEGRQEIKVWNLYGFLWNCLYGFLYEYV